MGGITVDRRHPAQTVGAELDLDSRHRGRGQLAEVEATSAFGGDDQAVDSTTSIDQVAAASSVELRLRLFERAKDEGRESFSPATPHRAGGTEEFRTGARLIAIGDVLEQTPNLRI